MPRQPSPPAVVPRRAGGGAPSRLRPLRRPRRLHDALRVARRRGGAGAPLPLLRHVPAADRALRRHGREVHRRRGDGRLGDADGDRGRRRAGGARRARPRRRGLGARRRGRRAGAAGAGRRADGRGGGHARRRGRGHGRGRSRQHGLADPVGRRAGHRARRRVDAPRDRADDRLRGCRLVRAEGQGGPDAAVAGAASRLGLRGALKSHGLEAPFVGRDRELRQIKELFHASADEGRRTSSRSPGIAGIGKSRLGVGVLQVLRRHRRDRLLAPGPMPLLRRGRHLLGARRHGADALPDRRGGGAGVGARRSCARRWRSTSSTPRSGRFVEPRLAHLLGLASTRRATSRTCSQPGACSSSAWPRAIRPCSCSRTCSGRTRACSTSSSTCSSGREARRSSWSRSPGRSSLSAGRPGAPDNGTSRPSISSRCPQTAMEELLDGLVPGLPDELREQILARAEGVPLYAVETVRMLLDRGAARAGGLGLPAGRRDRRARGARRRCTR